MEIREGFAFKCSQGRRGPIKKSVSVRDRIDFGSTINIKS